MDDNKVGRNQFKDSLNALLATPQDKKSPEGAEATEAKGKSPLRATQVSDVKPRVSQEGANLSEGRKLSDMPVSSTAYTTDPSFLTGGDKKRVKMHNTAFKNVVKQISLSKKSIEYKNLCGILGNISRIPNDKHAEIALKYLTDNARKVLDNDDYTQCTANISIDMMNDAVPNMADNNKKMPKKTSGASYNTPDVIDAAFAISANLGAEPFLKVTNHFLNSADELGCMTQSDYTDSLFVKSIYTFTENQIATIIDSKQIADKHLNFLREYSLTFQEYNAKQQSQDVATPTASTHKYHGRELPTPNETPIPTESTSTERPEMPTSIPPRLQKNIPPKKLPRTIFLQPNQSKPSEQPKPVATRPAPAPPSPPPLPPRATPPPPPLPPRKPR